MAPLLTSGTIWSFTLGVLLFIAVSYFVTYYFVYLRQIKRWEQSNIPFLQPTFLLGHKCFLSAAKYVAAVPMDQVYKENAEKDIIGLFFTVVPLVMLKDRKLIRDIAVKYSRQTFATGLAVPESEVEAQYTIMTTSNEEKWKFSRTAMIPAFSASWFQGSRFERIKQAIYKLWYIAEQVDSDGSSVNVTEVSQNAVLDIAASNFGIDSHSHTMTDGLRTILKTVFEPSFNKTLIFFFYSFFPFLRKFESIKLMPRKICDIMSGIINRQIYQRDQMNINTGDFIDLLRSLRTNQEFKRDSNKDSGLFSISKELTAKQMTALGLVYLGAGSETSARLLEFAIHSLSLYPEYQHKIRKEVHESLEKHGVSEFNFEVVRSLHFTFQCLFETSRLFPMSPLMRQCIEDFQVQGTNYIFRKGDRLIVPVYSLSRDETTFPDPHSFVPERFNSKDSNFAIPGTLLAFGIGQRKCPGYQHGLIVAAALLASLVYKYDIKPRSHLKLMDATDFHPRGFTLCSRRDIFVDLVRCQNLCDL